MSRDKLTLQDKLKEVRETKNDLVGVHYEGFDWFMDNYKDLLTDKQKNVIVNMARSNLDARENTLTARIRILE